MITTSEHATSPPELHYYHFKDIHVSRSSISTLLAELKACSGLRDLKRGKQLHAQANSIGEDKNIFVGNSLINMYTKCGCMHEARKLFYNLPSRSIVSWNTLILGYAEQGHGNVALNLFEQMPREGFVPDAASLVAACKACSSLAAGEEAELISNKLVRLVSLERVMYLRSKAVESHHQTDELVRNSFIDSYAKCGSMLDARVEFDRMKYHSVVSWTALLLGYADNGDEHLALQLFYHMLDSPEGLQPNSQTFLVTLKACCNLALKEQGWKSEGKLVKLESLENGMLVHSEASRRGCDKDVYVASTLINMYSKCGSMPDAETVFNKMPFRNAVSYNLLMLGYVDNAEEELALTLLTRMQQESCKPNAQTFVAALKACTSLASQEDATRVDGKLLKLNSLYHVVDIEAHLEEHSDPACKDLFVFNTLVDAYCKCGDLPKAHRVFHRMPSHSTVSWTALILGYAEDGEGVVALQLFEHMDPSAANSLTYVAALKACLSISLDVALTRCMEIHSRAFKAGVGTDILVASSLVDVYAKSGSMVNAREVFERMTFHDNVSWNTLLLGYVDNEEPETVLELFERMTGEDGCRPSGLSFVAALRACSLLAAKEPAVQVDKVLIKRRALETGMELHSRAAETAWDSNVMVGNTLVDMYSRCGSILDARRVFDRMAVHNLVSWNGLVLGYVEGNEGELASKLYKRLMEDGHFEPNAQTYMAGVKACGSVIDLKAGKTVHGEICRAGLEETEVVLVNCLVDFYGKCGIMVHVELLLESLTQNNVTWTSALAAYGRQGDTERVFQLFHDMQEQGLEVDGVTSLCVLSACSHAGLVDKGSVFFEKVVQGEFQGVKPTPEHYICLVDLFGRANRLDEAVRVVESSTMGLEENAMVWRTVLGACWKWKNVSVAQVAYERLMKLNALDSGSCSLMANIYGSS